MTDGQSETAGSTDFASAVAAMGNIPVVSIAFGDADKTQLNDLAKETNGSVVDSTNLVEALRQATGYK